MEKHFKKDLSCHHPENLGWDASKVVLCSTNLFVECGTFQLGRSGTSVPNQELVSRIQSWLGRKKRIVTWRYSSSNLKIWTPTKNWASLTFPNNFLLNSYCIGVVFRPFLRYPYNDSSTWIEPMGGLVFFFNGSYTPTMNRVGLIEISQIRPIQFWITWCRTVFLSRLM